MSDEWLFYPCQMGEHHASIFFDHGIRETIDQIAPAQLLKVRLTFRDPQPGGLSSSEEYPALIALEDDLQALVDALGSFYVGRVTVAGHRYFHIFTAETDATWSSKLGDLGTLHGYALPFVLAPDEGREGYWRDLFPSDEEWQVIMDIRLLDLLTKQGDDGSISRRIEHWAYFPSSAAAGQFSSWAQGQGYELGDVSTTEDGKQRVRFFHEGGCQLPDITPRTIALQRRASDLGGEYDGWETPVCKAPA
jgi:Regulator of ribonuclease activity B/Family of unknown function (DUF695)